MASHLSRDASTSPSDSSTTTSNAIFTPVTDDLSTMSDFDPDVPVESVESVQYTPASSSLASIGSFNSSFTFRTPSPDASSATADYDTPEPPMNTVRPSAPVPSQEGFHGYFTWRSSHDLAPSISLSPPAAGPLAAGPPAAGPPAAGPPAPNAGSGAPANAIGSRSPHESSRPTSVDRGMQVLRLSESSAVISERQVQDSRPSPPSGTSDGRQPIVSDQQQPPALITRITISSEGSPASSRMMVFPAAPTSTSANEQGGAAISSQISTPEPATVQSSPVPSTGSHAQSSDSTPAVFNLSRMQSALPGSSSPVPNTPFARPFHQHLSSSPGPSRPDRTSRRRRSSSAVPIPRHEVSSETPPSSRFHEPSFQHALLSAKELMSDLSAVLSSSQLHQQSDSTLHTLHAQAVELSEFTSPSTRTVGFVGDSGVGKSSLINSLLDTRGLARTSASGAACTCVATEYAYRPGDGFVVEAEWFTREELESQIKEMVEDYRDFHLMENIRGDDVAEAGDRARVAEDMIRAMFGERIGGAGEFERLLLDGVDENGDRVVGEEEDYEDGSVFEARLVQRFMSWVPDMSSLDVRSEMFEDVESCAQRLMKLTSDLGAADGTASWPFLRKIRVSCNAHILSTGLVLVDLPGLRDRNSARANIAERYVLNCDEIFAVCNIIRAITDEGVMRVIDLANRASLAKVGIICTRSDEIRAEEAQTDWSGELAQSVTNLQANVTVARHNLRAINEELEEYQETAFHDLPDEEREDYLLLLRDAAGARRSLAHKEFDLKRYLVRTRNHIVCAQLGEAYAERIPGDNLSVFCVSNKDYWDNRDLPVDVARDWLDLSGVIEVRRHCIAIVAESQLRASTLYMQQEIPALLESVQLWVQSGSGTLSAERQRAITETLDRVERGLRRGLTGARSRLMGSTINDPFQHFLAHYRSRDIWARAASNAANEWSGWHHATYAAFCRNFGSHATNAVGSHNWNEEATESMVFTLSPAWRALCVDIESQTNAAVNVLEELCDEAVNNLESETQFDDGKADVLISSIRTQQALLQAKLDTAYMEARRSLATLRTDVLSGIRTSFIGQAMEASYRACNRESGTGSDARRKAIINRRLRGESLFLDMETELRANFGNIAEELLTQKMNELRMHFRAIKRNFDIVRDENIIVEAESDPELRGRVDEELRRVRGVLDDLLAGL